GEHRFPAARSLVWEKLLDPETLRTSIPGCEDLKEVGPDSYDMTVTIGISAIRGTYSGNVTMADAEPEETYRLVAKGSGRAGSVNGSAQIRLADDGDGTLLTYEADLKATGPIARLGGRLVGSAAKMMVGRFFKAMDQHIRESGS
ncbi:MAG: carbon monoxide dehydrogenase subunit G, partial [Dehalococcoidia bacterium]